MKSREKSMTERLLNNNVSMRTMFGARKGLQVALVGTGLFFCLWTIAALASSRPASESLLLVIVQTVLTLVVLLFFVMNLPRPEATNGPGVMIFVALNVLLFYGIANIIPALLPGLRPDAIAVLISYRIPEATVTNYVLASTSAGLLFLGIILGDKVFRAIFPLPSPKLALKKRSRVYAWLPGYKASYISCFALLLLNIIATFQYGFMWGTLLTDEMVANISWSQQLLFHGMFPFMPTAPLLAACAYVQAENMHRKRRAYWLLIITSVLIVCLLSIWRMRSTVILAVVLPILLLSYTGVIGLRRAALRGVLLIVVIYAIVTAVRISDLQNVVNASGKEGLRVSDILSALDSKPGEEGILKYALADISYNKAGLEAVAALIQAQQQQRLEAKWGKVIASGFLQALPAVVRSEFEINDKLKTAPSYYGIFEIGDWVTTILAEFVLDFGPVLLFIPAIFAGLSLSLIDRTLLWLGTGHSLLQGLLIIRLVWLTGLGTSLSSISDTMLFFKATVGFTLLLLFLCSAVRFRVRIY